MQMTTNRNTEGVRAAYCLERAKGRAANALWGLFFLFLGLCMGVYGFTQLGEDKTGWDYMEYIKMGAGWLLCAGFTAAGAWECFTSLRDSLQPGKSTLARSICAQLPRPEEAPDWQELFAMVDRDLAAGANWFEKVGIGREWVLGDEASYIPNIRGVYRRHEIHYRSGGGNRHITQLLIVDHRQKSQITDMMDYRELDAAVQCLRLRAPAAAFGDYNDYLKIIGCSQDDWDRREHDFRLRQGKLAERAATPAAAGVAAGFALTRIDGQRTSQVTGELVAQQVEALQNGQGITLNPTPPIPAGMGEIGPGITEELMALNCVRHGDGSLWLVAILKTTNSPLPMRGFGMIGVEKERALEVLLRLLETRQAPDVFGEGWQAVQVQAAPEQEAAQRQAPYLNITDGAGASRKYERFSQRDVELAAQKVADGSYREAILWLPPRLIMLDAGDKNDARATIQISLPLKGAFRTFREKTSGRQAAEWFVGCLGGQLPEGFQQWKEVTKEWERRIEKLEKQKKRSGGKK